MSHPTRDELDDRHTWDLARIYETPADFERARDDLRERVDRLLTDDPDSPAPPDDLDDAGPAVESDPADGTARPPTTPAGSTASPGALVDALEAIADLLVDLSRLELYAQLRRDEAVEDGDRRDRYRAIRTLSADVDEAVRRIRAAIAADADRARRHRSDPALSGWRDYLDDQLARAPHLREPAVESVLATFDPVVDGQTDTVVAVTNGDFDPPTVDDPDGDPVAIDRGGYVEALDSRDRAFRRRAHEAYLAALGEHEHALAAAFARKAEAHAALAEVRGYDSVRAMALSEPSYPDTGVVVSVEEATHDAVLSRVREHREAYHELLESRRRLLGVDRLRPWDTGRPLAAGSPPEVSYEQLRTALLAAVEPLGEDYRQRLATLLDQRRVDVYPTERKRSDVPAYCPSSPETGAFVLANFREDLRTAFHLAHELGHAMHIAVLRDAQPARYVTSPRPVSEVPSVLHELLLADHLRERPVLAPFVRERRAELLAGNVFGAGQSAAFLHEAYRAVEDGTDPTPDRLADRYEAVAADFRGPVDPVDPGRGWRRQAFARDPYHNYQYVTGAVTAVAVHRQLRSGELSPATYREFLATTGRRDAADAFATLDVDPTDPAPYEALAAELDAVRRERLATS